MGLRSRGVARFSDLGRLSVIAPSEPELSSKWCPRDGIEKPEPRSPNTDTSAKVLSSEKTLHPRSPRGHSDRTQGEEGPTGDQASAAGQGPKS